MDEKDRAATATDAPAARAATAAPRARPRKPDETIPGGAYIAGGKLGDDDQHYGGQVVDAEGRTLATFDDDAVNDGRPRHAPDDPKRPHPAAAEIARADKAAAAAKPAPAGGARPAPPTPPAPADVKK